MNSRRSFITLLVLLALLLANVCFLSATGNVTGPSSEVTIDIDGPDRVPITLRDSEGNVSKYSTILYTIDIAGGPAEAEGIWEYSAQLLRPDREGVPSNLTPRPPVLPATDSSMNESSFTIEVTMPFLTQRVLLVVNASSTADNNTVWNEATMEIAVVIPRYAYINATIRNPSRFNIMGVNVSFYIENELSGIESVDIPATSGTTIVHQVDITGRAAGKYRVKIVIDPDNDVLEFDEGNNIIYKDIYIDTPPEAPPSNAGLYILLGIIVLLALLFLLRMRGGR